MIRQPLGRGHVVDGNDVRAAKTALSKAGLYRTPSYGLTPYPDEAMMRGIETVQRHVGAAPDGVMRPGDVTHRALEQAAAAGGLIHVRAHTRVVNGKTIQVAAHDRQGNPRIPPPAHVAKNIADLEKQWTGKWVGESDQCVALVKKAVPSVGQADKWREGEKIRGLDDPSLEPGTAIATFKNGRYANEKSGNHAAIFLEYGTENGKPGMWVLDQSGNTAAQRRFFPFNDPKKISVYRAENYSVIKPK